jgi:hypothetical protein
LLADLGHGGGPAERQCGDSDKRELTKVQRDSSVREDRDELVIALIFERGTAGLCRSATEARPAPKREHGITV